MMTPRTEERARQLGLRDGQQFWIVGRAGVLGDGDADVATAGLAFLAPDLVGRAWEHLDGRLTPRDVATEYAALIDEWGDAELPRFGDRDLARLDELARRVIDAAPSALGAVFAGWRVMPQPADLGARVALSMHVLREMRGGAHIAGVLAAGLSPLQAVLSSPAPPPRTGPAWAEHLGWTGPFEDPEPLRPTRQRAEDLNNTILEPFFAVLDDGELDELARLLVGIRDRIDM